MSIAITPDPLANKMLIEHPETGASMVIPWDELDNITDFLIDLRRLRDDGSPDNES